MSLLPRPRRPDGGRLPPIDVGKQTWEPSRRYVTSQFEMFHSAQREPDPRWTSGYAEARYSASPMISMVNVSGDPIYFCITFWNEKGTSNPEMSLVGCLPSYRSDAFRIGDHPKVKWASFKPGQKSGDIFTAWRGFIEIFATGDIFPQGWINYQRKATLEPYSQDWARQMVFAPVAEMRTNLDLPKRSGTVSEQFQIDPLTAQMADYASLLNDVSGKVGDFIKEK